MILAMHQAEQDLSVCMHQQFKSLSSLWVYGCTPTLIASFTVDQMCRCVVGHRQIASRSRVFPSHTFASPSQAAHLPQQTATTATATATTTTTLTPATAADRPPASANELPARPLPHHPAFLSTSPTQYWLFCNIPAHLSLHLSVHSHPSPRSASTPCRIYSRSLLRQDLLARPHCVYLLLMIRKLCSFPALIHLLPTACCSLNRADAPSSTTSGTPPHIGNWSSRCQNDLDNRFS